MSEAEITLMICGVYVAGFFVTLIALANLKNAKSYPAEAALMAALLWPLLFPLMGLEKLGWLK